MNQNELLDPNLYEIIKRCSIQKKSSKISEIVVTYENGVKERIWTFNPNRYKFDYRYFLGKSKIEAVFYCDRQIPAFM
jgi:hypothetical protein